jgi:hypothetical protein
MACSRVNLIACVHTEVLFVSQRTDLSVVFFNRIFGCVIVHLLLNIWWLSFLKMLQARWTVLERTTVLVCMHFPNP